MVNTCVATLCYRKSCNVHVKIFNQKILRIQNPGYGTPCKHLCRILKNATALGERRRPHTVLCNVHLEGC